LSYPIWTFCAHAALPSRRKSAARKTSARHIPRIRISSRLSQAVSQNLFTAKGAESAKGKGLPLIRTDDTDKEALSSQIFSLQQVRAVHSRPETRISNSRRPGDEDRVIE